MTAAFLSVSFLIIAALICLTEGRKMTIDEKRAVGWCMAFAAAMAVWYFVERS